MRVSNFSGRLEKDYPLQKLNTWKIGGPAEHVFWPSAVNELIEMADRCRNARIPFYVIGRGSNVLFPDAGLNGMVIVTTGLDRAVWADCGVRVEAGFSLMRLAREAAGKGLLGLEFACGIPGTAGAAVAINAGAHDAEMSRLVAEVKILTDTGAVEILQRRDMAFGYRHSSLLADRSVVLEALLQLQPGGDPILLKNTMQEHLRQRRKAQPLEYPNAGSVFRNPPGDSAGRLVEAAGWKGYRIGDAQISEKHANFIVNLGKAKADDVIRLVQAVQNDVMAKFSVKLETEIRVINS